MARRHPVARGLRAATILALCWFVAFGAVAGTADAAVPAGDPPGTPLGHFDDATAWDDGVVTIEGWALDPDTTAPVYIWVTIDGQGEHVLADDARPDIAAAFPSFGSNHGFYAETTGEWGPRGAAGTHSICVAISNVGRGTHKSLGCREVVVVLAGSPVGNWESTRVGLNVIEVRGWAIDPDSADAVAGRVSLSGTTLPLVADRPRADLAAAFPEYGAEHGFYERVPAAAGYLTLCVRLWDRVPPGDTVLLGCGNPTVASVPSPIGNLELVRGVAGGVEVKGWAVDQNQTSPLYVWVTVDGVGSHVRADGSRPDVRDGVPVLDVRSGFQATISAPPGARTVCVAASNVGPGTHTPLGCSTVSVPSGA